MIRIIAKIFVGIGIWIMIIVQFARQNMVNRELIYALSLLWSLGTVFGFLYHIRVIVRMLDPSLKLSVISFLSFRSGVLGSLPLFIYIIYALVLGWIHGLILMAREIGELRESNMRE